MSTPALQERPQGPIRRFRDAAADRLRRARRRSPAPTGRTTSPEARKRAWGWAGAIAAALVAGVALVILLFDPNWLRGPVERIASARLHRTVTIAGDITLHPWSWQPGATVGRVRVADPAWAGKGNTAEIEKIAVRIRLAPLLRGRVDLPLLQVDKPDIRLLRDAQGRATWNFSGGPKGAPLKLPPIQRFLIQDGRLRIDDRKRGLTFSGTVNAAETQGVRTPGFRLEGEGSLNEAPFEARVAGGPLLNIRRDQPYPFDAVVRAGATRITARGAIPRPFDLGVFYMNTTAQGPDLADLYGLTGVTLPNTPPYRLSGRLARDGHVYRITGLGGRVGDSDLSGALSVDGSGDRPFLKANLESRSLDFDDLATVFGGAPKTGAGETASASQVALAQEMRAQRRLLPDAPLRVERIRAMDADVTFRARQIRDAPIPLSAGSAHLKLDRGLLRADPVDVTIAQGRLTGRVALDARAATPVTDLDIRMTGARLESLIPVKGDALKGALAARAKLRGAGNSVRAAASNADGEVLVVAPGGSIREAFAELLGINVTKGLGLLFSKDRSEVPVRCAVAHFRADDGVLTANRIVFDTGPVLATGSGTVDLGRERLALRIQGHPKEARLVRLIAPITVEGPLTSPKVGVEAGKAVAQGGIAAALAALVTPLAAILPFIDPGLAKDANCGALIAGAAQQGAPIKAAAH
jgi:uncharacterized protein involved in outer membrane biogenesis